MINVGAEYTETYHGEYDVLVAVDKSGGGTVGNKYTGQWFVSVYVYGDDTVAEVARYEDVSLYTGSPTDHMGAAKAAFDFWEAGTLVDEDEDLGSGGYGRCERCGDPIDYCQGHGELG